MAQLHILRYPDPRLHTVAKPVEAVDERIRRLVDDMLETMYAADGVLGGQVSITDTETQPRGFDVSADDVLVASGERSAHVSAYRVELDGSLTLTSRVENGDTPNWVTISSF